MKPTTTSKEPTCDYSERTDFMEKIDWNDLLVKTHLTSIGKIHGQELAEHLKKIWENARMISDCEELLRRNNENI